MWVQVLRNKLLKLYKFFGKKIFEKADAVVCVSNYEKKIVLRDFKLNKNIYVVPNGINSEEFKEVDKIKKEKDKSTKTILYVGRIEKYKGLDYVVKALKNLPENFVLEVVGKGSYKPKVVELARNLGVIGRVNFYQDLSRMELVEKYAKADVLVLLSKHEAYGLVVAEALAARTPCVVAKTSALSEWIDEKNVFGVEYPPDIIEVSELIKKVSDVRVENFSILDWKDVADRLREIYLSLERS